MPRLIALLLGIALGAAACAAFTTGRDFSSPGRETIRNGTTTKADLVRLFGEPTQVGIDDGDQTWSWIYFKKGDPDLTKTLTIRFQPTGVVKSYSFSSNFPEDMKALR